MSKQIYNLDPIAACKFFKSSERGLSEIEVAQRLREFGFNKVKKQKSWSWLGLLVGQFNNALVWILLVAAGLASFFQEWRDVTIILVIVAINATIGFLQEFRAEKTLDEIKNLASDKARVLRANQKQEIAAENLVPGDLIFLSAGDKVPADAYLLESYELAVNEFIFTGESKAATKLVGALAADNLTLGDRKNLVFMGTEVARGEARAMVIGTGMTTELGKIADLVSEVKEEDTPLQKQLRILGRDVTVLALFIAALVLIAGRFFEMSWYHSFLFALALSVSVVPEGLPAAVSVALSLGMRKLLKYGVLAKKLNAVETLASVTVICTDKTGTITQNELMVTDLILGLEHYNLSGQGYVPQGDFSQSGKKVSLEKNRAAEMLFRIATLCNNAALIERDGVYKIAGDPTEGALLVAAQKFNAQKAYFTMGWQKFAENPFASERMLMSVGYIHENENVSLVKGSPEKLLLKCGKILLPEGEVSITAQQKDLILAAYDRLANGALRSLGFAYRKLPRANAQDFLAEGEKDLIWVGMTGMFDPPRPDVARAVAECHASGMKAVMITGDYAKTAEAIARQVGLISGQNALVISGSGLTDYTDAELVRAVQEREVVFARIAPEQKLRIATALKNAEVVIAMTGDGVNDAPALKKADIGVAMGKIGTDVAKEAADVILLEDNFAAIVRVVKEGRTIYQNLKKFVHYVFTSNASEFLTVVIGVLLGIPSPIIAVQILAIDLGTDIVPSFSLSLEPAEPTIMRRKPFSAKERILTAAGAWRLLKIGLIMAVGAVIAFIWSLKRGGWDFGQPIDTESLLYVRSTTATYTALALSQMANLLQARSETISVFRLGFFRNKYAIGAVFISVGILLVFMYVPFFQNGLRFAPIQWQDWLVAILTTIAVFVFEEIRKAEEK